jgi:hypothetical protein
MAAIYYLNNRMNTHKLSTFDEKKDKKLYNSYPTTNINHPF